MKRQGRVLFCSDDRGFPQLQVALYSLLKSAASDRQLQVFVFTGCGALSEAHVAKLKRTVAAFPFASLETVAVDALLARHLELLGQVGGQWGPMIWARCLIGEVLRQESGNIVYLDIDTFVCHDLAELYDMDMSDCGDGRSLALGAVCEEHRDSADVGDLAWCQGMMNAAADRYFNSGVLLMNIDAFREGALFDRLVAWYADHRETAKRPDQDALNCYLWDRTLFLHPRYNHCDGWLERQSKSDMRSIHWRGNIPKEILEAVVDPAILHFWGGRKPWRWNHRPEGRRYELVMRELGILTGPLPGTTLVRRIVRRIFDVYHAMLRHGVIRKLELLEKHNG